MAARFPPSPMTPADRALALLRSHRHWFEDQLTMGSPSYAEDYPEEFALITGALAILNET